MRSALRASVARALAIGCLLLAAASVPPDAAAQTPEALSHYRTGVAALNEGRFEAARQALLEAVQADPSFAGAWLDLAIACYGAGDRPAAEEFLGILERRFVLPEAITAAVGALRVRIQDDGATVAASSVWNLRRQVQLAVGHDTNANSGLALGELTLTLPGGQVALPVSSEVQPRADNYALVGLGAVAARNTARGRLELGTSVRARRNFTERDYDTLELRAGASWVSSGPAPGTSSALLPGPWRLNAAFQQLRLGGHALASSVSFGAEHLWPGATCQPRVGAEIDFRSYPAASTLNATYLWLGSSLSCPEAFGFEAGQFALQARVGRAHAQNGPDSDDARPGGNTRHLELGAAYEWEWMGVGGRNALQAQMQWERMLDSDGYSPLLSTNARRSVRRAAFGLTWSVPLPSVGDEWRAVVAFQAFRQSSNIEVFELSGRLLQLGVRRQW